MSEFGDHTVVDSAGDQIGKVTDVIAGPVDLKPEWLVVKLGPLAGEHLVPVTAVERRDDRVIVVGLAKADIKKAPKVKQHTAPTGVEREAVYRHYGLAAPTA